MNLVNYLKEEKHLTDRKSIIAYLKELNIITDESDLDDKDLLTLNGDEVDLVYEQTINFLNSEKYSKVKFTNKTKSKISFKFENSKLESLINLPEYVECLRLIRTNIINFNYSPETVSNLLYISFADKLKNLNGLPKYIDRFILSDIKQDFSFNGCENTVVDNVRLDSLNGLTKLDRFFKQIRKLTIQECPSIKSYRFPRTCGLTVFQFDQPRKLSLSLLLIPEIQTLEYIGFHSLHHTDEDTLHIFRSAIASGEPPARRMLRAQTEIIDHGNLDHILDN